VTKITADQVHGLLTSAHEHIAIGHAEALTAGRVRRMDPRELWY
jgi:hypothetical protein